MDKTTQNFKRLAALTSKKCTQCPKDDPYDKQFHCCMPVFCDKVAKAMIRNGKTPPRPVVGSPIPFLGKDKRCIVAPEDRPFCTAYVCDYPHVTEDKAFLKKYRKLCVALGVPPAIETLKTIAANFKKFKENSNTFMMLFLALVIGGCGVSSDKELEQHVNQFYKEAEARDYYVPVMTYILRFKALRKKCSKPQLCVDEGKWIVLDSVQKEQFIFELLSKSLLEKELPDVSPTIYERYRKEILDGIFRI